MRKLVMFGVAALAAMALPSTATAHGGPPVAVFTNTTTGSASVFFVGPCAGGTGTATIEFRDTFHVTQFADGHSVVTGNQTGTFEFTPDDVAAPTSSGRYRDGFSSTFTQNTGSSTSVFMVVGRDSNGEKVRFQVRSHFTFANGELRVDHFTVNCP